MAENKGEGGTKMEAAVNLREQPDIKNLLYALESSGLKKEQQEVETLVDYLEGMENQFSRMLSELREMQGTLTKIQDKGIRATVSRIVVNAEGKWREMQGQVSLIRENLIRSARNAVSAFKERGAEALRKMVFAMKIPNALCLMKNVLHSGMESMNRKAAKIAIIGGELGKAKGHLKNVVRVLTGKKAKDLTERNSDRGILAFIQKTCLTCGKMYSAMEQKTDFALKRIEQSSRETEEKSSVKADLRELKKGKLEKRGKQPSNQERG